MEISGKNDYNKWMETMPWNIITRLNLIYVHGRALKGNKITINIIGFIVSRRFTTAMLS